MSEMQPESAIDSLPEPWLKLPARSGQGGATEGPKPSAALEKYYQASAHQRSLRQAGADVKRRATLMERYSSQFFRVVRAAAWDRHKAQIAAAECEPRFREDRELWARRLPEVLEEDYAASRLMVAQGVPLMKLPLVD